MTRVPKLSLLVAVPAIWGVVALLTRGPVDVLVAVGASVACLMVLVALAIVETSLRDWADYRSEFEKSRTEEPKTDLVERLSQLRTTVVGRRAMAAHGDFPALPAGVAFDNFHFASDRQLPDRVLACNTWNRLLSTVHELQDRTDPRKVAEAVSTTRSLHLSKVWRTERPRAFLEFLDGMASSRALSHPAIALVTPDGLLGPQPFLPAAILEASRRALPLVDRAARGCLRIDASHEDRLVGLIVALAEHHEVLVRLDHVNTPSATLFAVYGRSVICASREAHPVPLALRIAHELAHHFRKDLHHAIGSTDRDFSPSAKTDRARREAGANALAIALVARLEILAANVEE